MVDIEEFKKIYSSQPTRKLLLLKFRGGLIKNALIALNSVLSQRTISEVQLIEAKLTVSEEEAIVETKNSKIEEGIEKQNFFLKIIKCFI